jgi:hypothetical protein
MQQLLIEAKADAASFQADLATQAEALANAGLSTLQVWTDDRGAVLALLQVVSRPKAEDWLATRAGLGHAVQARFLKTV